LERLLERDGIAITFKYSGSTDTKQGVIFGKDGLSFNGSKIDRAFSYSKLDVALNANAERLETRTTPTITPTLAPSPQSEHSHHSAPSRTHSSGDIISAKGDAFGAFSIEPGPGEEDNAPMPKKKKKKKPERKKGRSIS
jgi:hypothetical protein